MSTATLSYSFKIIFVSSLIVLRLRYILKMIWITASSILAEVIYMILNLTLSLFIHNAMNVLQLPVDTNLTVSSDFAASKLPAISIVGNLS